MKILLYSIILGLASLSLSGCSNSVSDKTEISKTEYECPMHCEGDKTYTEKGNCPVCKMKLTKK